MEVIKVENVSKKFKNRNLLNQYTTLKSLLLKKKSSTNNNSSIYALKNISVSIKKGQTIGVIGHNGSGKSTLLKVISKIYRPDSGQIWVKGRVSSLIELGAGFHPEFSGRENVFINGIILGLSKKEIRKKFRLIVEYADLEKFIDAPVRTYSSGMFMRLAFSVAVNIDPDILLIDEVLAVGDEAFSKKCGKRFEEFQKSGKTLVIVSHDLLAIEKWCEEVIWLNQGAIQAVGQPKKIIDQYKNSVSPNDSSGKEPLQNTNKSLEQGRRWGSKEIEIASIKLLDNSKKERFSYITGEKMTIEISYKVHKHVAEPVFGFGIYRPDGICCYGSNTDIGNIHINELKKDGVVSIDISHLDLIEGLYHLDIAVHDRNDHAYDYLSRCLSFLMSSDIKDAGIIRLRHTWEFE